MAAAPVFVLCEQGEHDRCPHQTGSSSSTPLFSMRRQLPTRHEMTLCACTCHEPCPLHGSTGATIVDYVERCTCPGGQGLREKWRTGSGHANAYLDGKAAAPPDRRLTTPWRAAARGFAGLIGIAQVVRLAKKAERDHPDTDT